MTAAWIVQRPNEDSEAFDTKEQAESRALVLGASCLVYRVEVEPDVREAGYWRRERAETGTTAPNEARTDPSATDVVLGRNGTIQEGAA